MATVEYPHEVSKGPLKGRTFSSASEQAQALAEFRASEGSLFGAAGGLRGDFAIRVLEHYDYLLSLGVPKSRAKVRIQQLISR